MWGDGAMIRKFSSFFRHDLLVSDSRLLVSRSSLNFPHHPSISIESCRERSAIIERRVHTRGNVLSRQCLRPEPVDSEDLKTIKKKQIKRTFFFVVVGSRHYFYSAVFLVSLSNSVRWGGEGMCVTTQRALHDDDWNQIFHRAQPQKFIKPIQTISHRTEKKDTYSSNNNISSNVASSRAWQDLRDFSIQASQPHPQWLRESSGFFFVETWPIRCLFASFAWVQPFVQSNDLLLRHLSNKRTTTTGALNWFSTLSFNIILQSRFSRFSLSGRQRRCAVFKVLIDFNPVMPHRHHTLW